jgi:hypothetical protein
VARERRRGHRRALRQRHDLSVPSDAATGTGGALGYLRRQFDIENSIECRFGTPIAAGERAAIEWWASWVEDERELNLAGATVLRFDDGGRVVEHVDYWVERDGRIPPFAGWGG